MHQQIILLVLSLLLCSSSWGQESNLLSTVSPNLRKFVIDHPTALKTLTNAFSDAFSNKTVKLYYFYSDDQSERRAFHFYPNTVGVAEVFICVPEDSTPADEFIGVLFETLNSKGEKRFTKLGEDAKAGRISRADFARGILMVEFEAMKSTRDLVVNLKLSKKEIAKSHHYGLLAQCPSEFEEFLSYQKKIFPRNEDPIKEYELKYDSLRNLP